MLSCDGIRLFRCLSYLLGGTGHACCDAKAIHKSNIKVQRMAWRSNYVGQSGTHVP